MSRSKRLVLRDVEKLKQINQDTQSLFDKYKIDMMMRNLSQNTQTHYTFDLQLFVLEYMVIEDVDAKLKLSYKH